MITLSDRELLTLKAQLHKIYEESIKEVQHKHRIYNSTNKIMLIIKKAERRNRGTLNF